MSHWVFLNGGYIFMCLQLLQSAFFMCVTFSSFLLQLFALEKHCCKWKMIFCVTCNLETATFEHPGRNGLACMLRR